MASSSSTALFHSTAAILLRNSKPQLPLPSSVRLPLPLPLPLKPPTTRSTLTIKSPIRLAVKASSSSVSYSSRSPSPSPTPNPLISFSTHTVTTLPAAARSLLRTISERLLHPPTGEEAARIAALRGSVASAVGPLFFAAGSLNTPLMVVASGMRRWLAIYSGVLLIRVLLSWFPNIPWERQPLSAMRDLCDPYLNLFRNIIPPVFDTLDVSPLLAFGVLGFLESIMDGVGV